MKMVKKYLTRHHLFHAPHRWFLALLISPIHFLELYYKKKYHLRFIHARKLFLFDMLLILSTIFLIIISIFWFTYNPTILNKISFTLALQHTTINSTRIKSGEHVIYLISYHNASHVSLISPAITVQVPRGFVLLNTSATSSYTARTHTFHLSTISPNASGTFTFSGLLFGIPNTDLHVGASLSYHQNHRSIEEIKTALILTTLRNSILGITITAPDKILPQNDIPFSLTLRNTSARPLTNIIVPLTSTRTMSIFASQHTTGTIMKNNWIISNMPAGSTATVTGTLRLQKQNTQTTTIRITPEITVNNFVLPQSPATHIFSIVHPSIFAMATWNNTAPAKAGDIRTVHLILKNTGTADLKHLTVSIPIPPSLISTSALIQKNNARYTHGELVFNETQSPNLRQLLAHTSTTLTIFIPVNPIKISGTNVTLILTPRIRAWVAGVSVNPYEITTQTTPLPVATQLLSSVELRYYTNEGDQLGLGPLPPIVGTQTMYWVLVQMKNTTNKIDNLHVAVQLNKNIKWIGKTSVSNGSDATYNASTHIVSWSLNYLNPHERAGIFFALGLTPTTIQKGSTPVLVEYTKIYGHDAFTNTDITKSFGALTTAIPTDLIGKSRGTLVH